MTVSPLLVMALVSAGLAEASAEVAGPAASCLEAQTVMASGSIPDREDFRPAVCQPEKLVALSYDSVVRVPRVTQAIQVGDMVRPWPGAGGVRPGDPLILTVFVGAVQVEREVTALQPAAPGGQLFVRDGQGEVFSVRYERAAR